MNRSLMSAFVRNLANFAFYQIMDEWWERSRELYSEENEIWQNISDVLEVHGKLLLGRGKEKDERIMDLLESLYQANHRISLEKAREIYLHFLGKGSRKAFLFYYFFDRAYRSPELITFLSLPEVVPNDEYVREKVRQCQSELQ